MRYVNTLTIAVGFELMVLVAILVGGCAGNQPQPEPDYVMLPWCKSAEEAQTRNDCVWPSVLLVEDSNPRDARNCMRLATECKSIDGRNRCFDQSGHFLPGFEVCPKNTVCAACENGRFCPLEGHRPTLQLPAPPTTPPSRDPRIPDPAGIDWSHPNGDLGGPDDPEQ